MTPPLLADLAVLPVRWQVTGTIAAPVAAVAALLFAVGPGRIGYDNALVLADLPAARLGLLSLAAGVTPDSFRVVGLDDEIDLAVDRDRGALGIRCWFGSVHTVQPYGPGCRVVHRVHFAPSGDGIEQRMRDGLTRVLDVIADRLDTSKE
jgi:hypothetical protein